MALLEVAVQGLTLTVTGGGAGTAAVTSTPSTDCKAEAKGVYSKELAVTLSGCSSGTCGSASGSGKISPTAVYTKADGELVMRKGDKNTAISVTGTDSVTELACSFSVKVEITNAGQTKVKGQ